MVNRFKLKTLFSEDELCYLKQNFGFKRMSILELEHALYNAFETYILAALSEISDENEDHQKLLIEATLHLDRARKLLDGMPHPSGKMAHRLTMMISTLNKIVEVDDWSTNRASRFMEKNLVRRLRDIWCANTSTPFHAGGDGSGKNPRDFILYCFAAAAHHYSDITWFREVDYAVADLLIKRIKR